MRKFISVLIVMSVVVATAIAATRDQRHWTRKVDSSLISVAKSGNAAIVGAVIRVQPGAAHDFVAHLARHGVKGVAVAADTVAAQLPASMVRRVAIDRDVVHLSPQ